MILRIKAPGEWLEKLTQKEVALSVRCNLCSSLRQRIEPTCTGVLTKADTVQDGEHDKWLDVVEGRRYHLQLGYFCTKQPLKLDLSFEESRSEEVAFFKRTEPWKSFGAGIQQRYGTDSLISFLSGRLSQYISDT